MIRRQGKVTAASNDEKTDILKKNLTKKANENKQPRIQRAETKVIKKLQRNHKDKMGKSVLPSVSDLLKRPCSPTPNSEPTSSTPPVTRFWVPLNNDDKEFVDSIFKERKGSPLTALSDSDNEANDDTELRKESIDIAANEKTPLDDVVASSITSDKNSTGFDDFCDKRLAVRFHNKKKSLLANNEVDTEKEHVLYFYTRSDPEEGTESRHLMTRPDPRVNCRLYGFMPPSKRGLRVDTPCRNAGLSLRKNRDIHEYGLDEILLCDKKNNEANDTDDKYPSLKIILDVERLISGNRGLLKYKASLTQREETCRVLENKRKSLLKIIETKEELLDRYKEQLAGKEAKYRRLLFDNVETKAIMKKQQMEFERLLTIEKQFYDQREELNALKEEHLNSEKSVITSCPIENNYNEEIHSKMDITSCKDVAIFSSRVTNLMARLVDQSDGIIDQTCIEDVADQFECCVYVMEKLFKDNIGLKQELGLEADFPLPETEENGPSNIEVKDPSKSIPKLQQAKPEKVKTQKGINKTNLHARKIGTNSGRFRATNHNTDTTARRWR